MILMAKKNSTYQFVAMLLQFNFNVKVSRTTEGDDVVDILNVWSEKYQEDNTMSVYGSVDHSGSFILPVEELKKDMADLMCVVNYADGNAVVYRKSFFMENIKVLVNDGAINKMDDGSWLIYPKAISGIFKLHSSGDDSFFMWEHEGRMAYMYQRLEFNDNKNRF